MAYPVPDHEEERLRELREYDILDTAPEGIYDDLTFIASQICGTDVAAITLIDEDRQWLKAREGDIDRECDRGDAFCSHAIVDPTDVMVVPDATEDDRFRENPFVTGDPGIRFYAGAPLRTPTGRGLGTICAIDDEPRDLTDEQRRSLQALSRMVMTQLELRRRSAELRETKEALEERTAKLRESNQDLDRFASVVSHELRDPLGQVLSNLDLVRSGPSDLHGEDRELLEAAIRGGERMEALIEDLLRYSRAREQEIDRDPIDLEAVVDQVRKELAEGIDEAGATLSGENLGTAHGDGNLVRQVIQNLVGNALRYAGEGPRIEVRSRETGDGVRVEVADDGPGIPEGEHATLFGLFEQASTSATDRGTGVGLALCQRIVERHSGEMGLDSAQGEGATFWFTLPEADAGA